MTDLTPQQRACQAYTDSLGLKEGDRVMIQRFHTSRSYGWRNDWVRVMDAAVGKIGTVVKVHDDARGVNVAVGESSWMFPPYVLELLPRKRLRPYTEKELSLLIGEALVPTEDSVSPSLVVEAGGGCVYLCCLGTIVKKSSRELLHWYHFHDRTVCGVEE